MSSGRAQGGSCTRHTWGAILNWPAFCPGAPLPALHPSPRGPKQTCAPQDGRLRDQGHAAPAPATLTTCRRNTLCFPGRNRPFRTGEKGWSHRTLHSQHLRPQLRGWGMRLVWPCWEKPRASKLAKCKSTPRPDMLSALEGLHSQRACPAEVLASKPEEQTATV